MAGHLTTTHDTLIRAELWSNDLKEIFEDELMAMNYVNWMTDFPDGEQLTIPSIGQHEVTDVIEDADIEYRSLDTGEFNFRIEHYKSSATYITMKARQDMFYASRLEADFVPGQARALSVDLETRILALQNKQTLGNANLINDAPHRFVANGGAGEITLQDFALAHAALKKANNRMEGLVAIVDPSVEYTLNTLQNIANVSNNPKWEGIIESGLGSGMKFIKNIYGFDVYSSNYLAETGAETIGAKTTDATGVANLFFSAADKSRLPFIGAWRQMPRVDSEFNKDKQREEYITTARYGLDLYRPENLVSVLSNKSALPQE